MASPTGAQAPHSRRSTASAINGGLQFGIYAIFDPTRPPVVGASAADIARALLAGGVRILQLRAKQASSAQRVAALQQVAPLCKSAGCRLVINDDLEAADAGVEGLWGVHIGQEDLRDHGLKAALAVCERRKLRLGLSTHNLAQVEAAQSSGADHIGFGPVRSTSSKARPDPVTGMEGLRTACAHSKLPVVAIGGLGLDDVEPCRAFGASGIAMISALSGASLDAVRVRAEQSVQRWREA